MANYKQLERLLASAAEGNNCRAWNEWRRANLEVKIDLQGAKLREANLWEANLREADLRGADLEGAKLWEANLRAADLWGAKLREADLWGADLRGAFLSGAKNLKKAENLLTANWHGARGIPQEVQELILSGLKESWEPETPP